MDHPTFEDLSLDAILQHKGALKRANLFLITAVLLGGVSVTDWLVGQISLSVLYVIPMMTAALLLRPLQLGFLALFCAFLRSRFDYPGSDIELALRFIFATVSYFVAGLFVAALVRNRRMVSDHLTKLQQEQFLRKEVEDQLKALVASSPAAIFTLEESGRVLAANQAANLLFAIPPPAHLHHRSIERYLPILRDALTLGGIPEGFRTSAQCMGYRDNGEIFQAHTWFSSYQSPQGTRLAAIVVDSSEEMRDREEQSLQQILRSNRIATAGVFHELRNLCGAISLLCRHIADRHALAQDKDLIEVVNLIEGMQRMAAPDFPARVADAPIHERVPLRPVFDSLRVIIEPEWREADGTIIWDVPAVPPYVMAESHILLQAFLNLAKNSFRAVQSMEQKELKISLSVQGNRVTIRFEDTGAGIADPNRLFQPFQEGAEGSGLGLYLSRAVIRSYGGDLHLERHQPGACFALELNLA